MFETHFNVLDFYFSKFVIPDLLFKFVTKSATYSLSVAQSFSNIYNYYQVNREPQHLIP